MGQREMRFIVRMMPWIRWRSSIAAAGARFTDTEEVVGSVVGRLACAKTDASHLDDRTAVLMALGAVVIQRTVADHQRSGLRRRMRECDSRRVAERVSLSPLPGDDALLANALSGLSDGQYRVVVLAAKGMTSTQIGASLGMVPATVRTTLRTARAALRGSLLACGRDGGGDDSR